MKKIEIQLMQDLLTEAVELMARRGCNDMPDLYMKNFTREDIDKLNLEIYKYDDLEDYEEGMRICDSWLTLSYLVRKLLHAYEKEVL